MLNLKQGIKRKISAARAYYSSIGLLGLFSIWLSLGFYTILSKLGFKMHKKFFYCFMKGYQYPIALRYGTSDIDVFKQIFIEKEYSLLSHTDNFKFIIDCGAYAGYSSIYFLNKCPRAYIVAVEPEINNFDICKKNLSYYSKRVKLIHSAIYPYQTGITVTRSCYRDGREWTSQVRQSKGNETPDVVSVDIKTLINNAGFDTVDLLKIDIERSEIELFTHDYRQWLDKVRNIAIELHDEECTQVFLAAISDYCCDISRSGELTICKDIYPKNKVIGVG